MRILVADHDTDHYARAQRLMAQFRLPDHWLEHAYRAEDACRMIGEQPRQLYLFALPFLKDSPLGPQMLEAALLDVQDRPRARIIVHAPNGPNGVAAELTALLAHDQLIRVTDAVAEEAAIENFLKRNAPCAKRVLILDDDLEDALMTAELLERHSDGLVRSEIATHCRQAREMLDQYVFDALVIDYNLPQDEMNGVDFVASLGDRHRELPAVLITDSNPLDLPPRVMHMVSSGRMLWSSKSRVKPQRIITEIYRQCREVFHCDEYPERLGHCRCCLQEHGWLLHAGPVTSEYDLR